MKITIEQLHDSLVEHEAEIRKELDKLSATHETDATALDFVIVALRRLMGANHLLPASLTRGRS